MKKTCLSAIVLIHFYTYSNAQSPTIEKDAANNITAFTNIVYKIAGQDSLKLDIFLPTTKQVSTNYPVALFITGGAWVTGTKDMEGHILRKKLKYALLNNGFAIVSIEYRYLNDKNHFPQPIEDCKDAVRWVKVHAQNYQLDTANIGLIGESAGAHLALLTAYTNENIWNATPNYPHISTKVKSVVDYYGPTDINKLFKTNASGFTTMLAKLFIGKKFRLRNRLLYQMTLEDFGSNKKKVMEKLNQYSPLTYVTPSVVPTFIAHGNKDKLVPFAQSKKLFQHLLKSNHQTPIIKVKGADHGFVHASEKELDYIVDETIRFLKNQ